VRLFAQPTHAREASRQHPAGDVDAYAHTHAHADQLWGPQYENAKPAVPFLAYAQDTFGIPSYSGVCTFTQKLHRLPQIWRQRCSTLQSTV